MCRTWCRRTCLRLLWRACPRRPLKLTPLMIEQQRCSWLSRRFPVFLKTRFALDCVRILSTLVSHFVTIQLVWRHPLKLTPLVIEQQRGSWLSRWFPVFLKTRFALDCVRILSTLVSHFVAIQLVWLRGCTRMVVDRGPLSLTIAIKVKDFDCRCPWRESATHWNVDRGYGGPMKSLVDWWWHHVTLRYTCFVQHNMRDG